MSALRLVFPLAASLATVAVHAQDTHATHEAHDMRAASPADHAGMRHEPAVRPERGPEAGVEGPACIASRPGASNPRPGGRCARRERSGDARMEHPQHEPAMADADARPPSGHVAPPPPQHMMGAMSPARMIDVMGMDDRAPWGRAVFDRLEYIDAGAQGALGWSLRADYGGDVDRVQLRSEGERTDGRTAHGDVELLWSRAVAPYWNSQLGVRHDVGEGADRSWVAFGVQGLAPYWLEVAATAYVGTHGRTALRLDAEYEAPLTQRWVLQPRIELDAYGKDDPAARTGSGLADAAFGLRLRYEFTRGFAPYVGVEWARRFGRSADYARADGDDADDVRWVAGLRLMF